MRKHLRLLGSFVFASLTASGLALDAASVAAPFGISWKWIELFGFLIFVALVYSGWYKASSNLRKHEDTHPSIQVKPNCEGKTAWLEVQNTGHCQADFKVKVIEISGVEQQLPTVPKIKFPYIAKWLNTHDQQNFTLHSGDSNNIEIIESNGLIGLTEDQTKYQKVLLPTHWLTWEGRIIVNSSIRISIEILSDPPLRSPSKNTFTLYVDQNGMWQQFKEIR
jgi:membrane protein implicated in regulation of membrane protease activity